MSKKARQYTIRRVPVRVDRALRRKAEARGVSLNRLVLDALAAEAGVEPAPQSRTNLDRFIGSWVKDAAVDRALAAQRRVHLRDWE